MKRLLLALTALLLTSLGAAAQGKVTGCVTDDETGEPLPYASIFYSGGVGTQSDGEGKFCITRRRGKLCVSLLGYDTESRSLKAGEHWDVKLKRSDQKLKEAVVKGKKKRYSRKNNPAVEMMRKVIAAKGKSDIRQHDYCSVDRYARLTLAFNDVTENILSDDKFKRMPFLKNHVERSPETGSLILPFSMEETVTQNIYRKNPKKEKEIVKGRKVQGITEFFQTGDIVSVAANECFADVDIYKDDVMLLQQSFISPISATSAIDFYRYFIQDTLAVDGDTCFHLTFTPNNQKDVGFSGALYVMADSSWRVKKAIISVPPRSGVNWVDKMRIEQQFAQLPTGEQVVVSDNMSMELEVVDFMQKCFVKRVTSYSNFSFDSIPETAFKPKADKIVEHGATKRDEAFWEAHRSDTLSSSEAKMGAFVHNITELRFFKPVLFIAKALIENNMETRVDPSKPNKVDIGPVNTMVTSNFVDGLRLRASAVTTANLHPHFFLKGYVAYGFKDEKWKGMGEAIWSFNKREYTPYEFPVHSLSVAYTKDVMAPSDKFLPTDKDNMFVSLKWTTVDHMMYYENWKLTYDKEWHNGLRMKVHLQTEKDNPTASLFYQPLAAGENGTPVNSPAANVSSIRTTDATISLTWRPGVTWTNTKQRRVCTNHNAPRLSISHTVGVKGVLGSDYTYNITEGVAYKRFRIPSWGRIDVCMKAGVQWNKVPFPLLFMPNANLSYIIQDEMFNLIDNMEFPTDRYVSTTLQWNMNGKIFNRIPLLKRLEWREMVGCNLLWGELTDKNNPFLAQNAHSKTLFFFPGRFEPQGYASNACVMQAGLPYVEVFAGIHNIFKLLHVQYVHRLTYTERPDVSKWGVRLALRFAF